MYASLSPLSKYLDVKPVRIYDGAFVLQTKCTVAILIACTVLLSTKQLFGDPIECMGSEKNGQYMNSYCWTMGTFIVYNIEDNALIAEGVGPENAHTERIYLRYYQWVILLLLLQAFVFYLPSLLWKIWENQRLKQLCSEVDDVILSKPTLKERCKILVDYFSSDYRDEHLCYMVKYHFCEILNFIISIGNIMVMDIFFDDFWNKYKDAVNVIPAYNWNTWNRISSRVFPKIAKCDLSKFGPSGSRTKIDALCMLPLNILNEKIFAFLFVWFLCMAILSGIKLLYRMLIICSKQMRMYLLHARAHDMPKSHMRLVLKSASYGDWFLLYRVSRNINPILFRELMRGLHELCEWHEKVTI